MPPKEGGSEHDLQSAGDSMDLTIAVGRSFVAYETRYPIAEQGRKPCAEEHAVAVRGQTVSESPFHKGAA